MDFYADFDTGFDTEPSKSCQFEDLANKTEDLRLFTDYQSTTEETTQDFNLFEDKFEQPIMITKINVAAASSSTEASAATANQPITPGGIKQIFNDMEIKTADINADVDYRQLFRGLSTFELDRMDSLNGTSTNTTNNIKPALTNGGIKLQPQEELTDLLIQQQPTDIKLEVAAPVTKTFNTLTTMKLDNPVTIDNQLINKENNMLQQNELPGMITTSVRTSIDSNTSSSLQQIAQPPVTQQKKKRGRRPTSMLDMSNKSHQTRAGAKRELSIEAEKTVVSFGNKKVKKDTDEYKERRVKNNEAVKKCRMKNLQEQSQKEERMGKLEEENKRLTGRVESLMKELSVLKNIIVQMSPTRGKLPDHVEKMIKRYEEV